MIDAAEEIRRARDELVPERPADLWAEYQAAAQQLDAARSAATKVVAEQSSQLARARADLTDLQTRITAQRNRVNQASLSVGVPLADLEAGVRGRDPAVHLPHQRGPQTPAEAITAITRARANLDTVDAMLTTLEDSLTPTEPIGSAAGRRNAIVYTAWAAVFAIIQLPFVVAVLNDSVPGLFALCGIITPVFAYGLSWLTLGAVFKRPGIEVDRTPILGVLVSLGAAIPSVLMLLFTAIAAGLR